MGNGSPAGQKADVAPNPIAWASSLPFLLLQIPFSRIHHLCISKGVSKSEAGPMFNWHVKMIFSLVPSPRPHEHRPGGAAWHPNCCSGCPLQSPRDTSLWQMTLSWNLRPKASHPSHCTSQLGWACGSCQAWRWAQQHPSASVQAKQADPSCPMT